MFAKLPPLVHRLGNLDFAMKDNMRFFHAIIWTSNNSQPGERVTVLAGDLDEARSILEKKYGQGNVFYLRNEVDANKQR